MKFHRSTVFMGGTFDAREKIRVSDVRQRLGSGRTVFPVKDAREKLTQKDTLFRLRSRLVGGAVQDARQMINSRKQQGQKQLCNTAQSLIQDILQVNLQANTKRMHSNNSGAKKSFPSVNRSTRLQGLNSEMEAALQQAGGSEQEMDARERLSLKRSIAVAPSTGPLSLLKITKTVQCLSSEDNITPSKQMKITMSGGALQKQAGLSSAPFSLPVPITKVVQNDSYTAPPPPPMAVAGPRSSVSPPASCSTLPNLPPVSRTLVTDQAQHSADTFSPLEGTKMMVNNLHPRVTEEDIVELFCVCGALKRARLLRVGVAEVVFVRKQDAITAYRKYNNRCLDGQPMKCNLHIQGNVISSDQPILLRLSDTPGSSGGEAVKKVGLPPCLSRLSGRSDSSQPPAEVDPQTILKALFKSSTPVPSADSGSTQSTAFCIKI
ncbi:polymerase delta-interacting protein 3-like [Scleropages formosus]|uniref:Polymerase delta-interacting protein 3-like n=1 Tax=Scleropages formosus TaxID=113540 RepID=A0A0P7VB61_SCLFO|nr:polymerase delta-interacting protein 3-like [Scleropages formosus]